MDKYVVISRLNEKHQAVVFFYDTHEVAKARAQEYAESGVCGKVYVGSIFQVYEPVQTFKVTEVV